jgi:pimeloyl-ACP methyl ester carboxylesterase
LSSGQTLEEQADLYAALLDSLKVQRVAVIAYSAGGHSAIPFVLKYPERSSALVLLSGHTGRMGTYNASPSLQDRVGAFS